MGPGASRTLLRIKVGHGGRAADEDVSLGDVRHELEQVRRRQQIGVPLVAWSPTTSAASTPPRRRVELVAEDDVLLGDDAVEDDHVAVISSSSARIGVMPMPPAISTAFVACGAPAREHPERALGEHARPGRDRPRAAPCGRRAP